MRHRAAHPLLIASIALLGAVALAPWQTTYSVEKSSGGEWTPPLYWVKSHHWPLGQTSQIEGAFETNQQAQLYVSDLAKRNK